MRILLPLAVFLLLVPAAAGKLPPPPTETAAPSCAGDCSGDGTVTVNELIVGVNIALGNTAPTACPAFDKNRDQMVSINELIAAVNALLNGC